VPYRKHPKLELHSDGSDMFVVTDGLRIARRGHHNTPQAGTWISIEPGWEVIDNNDLTEISVRYTEVAVH
jgi:hypothetical protein